MSRLVDLIAFVCLLAGISGLAASGVLYFREHDSPGVRIEPDNLNLGELAANKKHEVELYIVNPTWHTVRLVGIGHC